MHAVVVMQMYGRQHETVNDEIPFPQFYSLIVVCCRPNHAPKLPQDGLCLLLQEV